MKLIKRIWWKHVMSQALNVYDSELLYRLARYKLYLNRKL